MNSDSAAAATLPTRQRLHSVTFHWLRRVFALLLAADAVRVSLGLWSEALPGAGGLSVALHAGAFLLLAYYLWFRARLVFATARGIELVSGGTLRVVSWDNVIDLREMPWMTIHPPWYPKLYQLELRDGESLDFIGRRDARAVVGQSLQRAGVALHTSAPPP